MYLIRILMVHVFGLGFISYMYLIRVLSVHAFNLGFVGACI